MEDANSLSDSEDEFYRQELEEALYSQIHFDSSVSSSNVSASQAFRFKQVTQPFRVGIQELPTRVTSLTRKKQQPIFSGEFIAFSDEKNCDSNESDNEKGMGSTNSLNAVTLSKQTLTTQNETTKCDYEYDSNSTSQIFGFRIDKKANQALTTNDSSISEELPAENNVPSSSSSSKLKKETSKFDTKPSSVEETNFSNDSNIFPLSMTSHSAENKKNAIAVENTKQETKKGLGKNKNVEKTKNREKMNAKQDISETAVLPFAITKSVVKQNIQTLEESASDQVKFVGKNKHSVKPRKTDIPKLEEFLKVAASESPSVIPVKKSSHLSKLDAAVRQRPVSVRLRRPPAVTVKYKQDSDTNTDYSDSADSSSFSPEKGEKRKSNSMPPSSGSPKPPVDDDQDKDDSNSEKEEFLGKNMDADKTDENMEDSDNDNDDSKLETLGNDDDDESSAEEEHEGDDVVVTYVGSRYGNVQDAVVVSSSAEENEENSKDYNDDDDADQQEEEANEMEVVGDEDENKEDEEENEKEEMSSEDSVSSEGELSEGTNPDLEFNLDGGMNSLLRSATADKDSEKWRIDDADRLNLNPSVSRYFAPRAIQCRNCKKDGHMSRDCPEPMKRRCAFCAKEGHSYQACPDAMCYNCEMPGHKGNQCQEPKRDWRMECSRCWMKGHEDWACPDRWRQYHLTTGKKGSSLVTADKAAKNPLTFCFNCGRKGHLGFDCRMPRMNRFVEPNYPFIARYDTKNKVKENEKRERSHSQKRGHGFDARTRHDEASSSHRSRSQGRKKSKKNRDERQNSYQSRSRKGHTTEGDTEERSSSSSARGRKRPREEKQLNRELEDGEMIDDSDDADDDFESHQVNRNEWWKNKGQSSSRRRTKKSKRSKRDSDREGNYETGFRDSRSQGSSRGGYDTYNSDRSTERHMRGRYWGDPGDDHNEKKYTSPPDGSWKEQKRPQYDHYGSSADLQQFSSSYSKDQGQGYSKGRESRGGNLKHSASWPVLSPSRNAKKIKNRNGFQATNSRFVALKNSCDMSVRIRK